MCIFMLSILFNIAFTIALEDTVEFTLWHSLSYVFPSLELLAITPLGTAVHRLRAS